MLYNTAPVLKTVEILDTYANQKVFFPEIIGKYRDFPVVGYELAVSYCGMLLC